MFLLMASIMLCPLYGVHMSSQGSCILVSERDSQWSSQWSFIQDIDVDSAMMGSQIQQWCLWIDEQKEILDKSTNDKGGGHHSASCLTRDQLQAVIKGADDMCEKMASLYKKIGGGHALKGQDSHQEKTVKYKNKMDDCTALLKDLTHILGAVVRYKNKCHHKAEQSVASSGVCDSITTRHSPEPLLSRVDESSDVTLQDCHQYRQYLTHKKEQLEKRILTTQDDNKVNRHKKDLNLLDKYIKVRRKKQQYEHALFKYAMRSQCATLIQRNNDLKKRVTHMLDQQPPVQNAQLVNTLNRLKDKVMRRTQPDAMDPTILTDQDKKLQKSLMQEWVSMQCVHRSLHHVESKEESKEDGGHEQYRMPVIDSLDDLPMGESMFGSMTLTNGENDGHMTINGNRVAIVHDYFYGQ